MTISLIHPSRSRPAQALTTFEKWMSKASGLHKIDHILSIDLSDPDHDKYKNQEYPYGITRIIGASNQNAVMATNRGAEHSKGDILIMLSDDFDCPQDWDKEICEAYRIAWEREFPQQGFILKTFDGLQKWIVTLAIMDRAYYGMQGYFYFPEYQHLFCDTELTHKADLEGRLIMRNDLVFPHNHYSKQGGNKKDAVNAKADATWNQGEAVYLKRVREKFGLNVPDVYAVNSEAKTHIQWLKNKMK